MTDPDPAVALAEALEREIGFLREIVDINVDSKRKDLIIAGDYTHGAYEHIFGSLHRLEAALAAYREGREPTGWSARVACVGDASIATIFDGDRKIASIVAENGTRDEVERIANSLAACGSGGRVEEIDAEAEQSLAAQRLGQLHALRDKVLQTVRALERDALHMTEPAALAAYRSDEGVGRDARVQRDRLGGALEHLTRVAREIAEDTEWTEVVTAQAGRLDEAIDYAETVFRECVDPGGPDTSVEPFRTYAQGRADALREAALEVDGAADDADSLSSDTGDPAYEVAVDKLADAARRIRALDGGAG